MPLVCCCWEGLRMQKARMCVCGTAGWKREGVLFFLSHDTAGYVSDEQTNAGEDRSWEICSTAPPLCSCRINKCEWCSVTNYAGWWLSLFDVSKQQKGNLGFTFQNCGSCQRRHFVICCWKDRKRKRKKEIFQTTDSECECMRVYMCECVCLCVSTITKSAKTFWWSPWCLSALYFVTAARAHALRSCCIILLFYRESRGFIVAFVKMTAVQHAAAAGFNNCFSFFFFFLLREDCDTPCLVLLPVQVKAPAFLFSTPPYYNHFLECLHFATTCGVASVLKASGDILS